MADKEQEGELLEVIEEIDWADKRMVAELFSVLEDWWTEREESKALLKVVCEKMAIDPIVFQIYRNCPPLIYLMEPLRKGASVRTVKNRFAMSEDARGWWDALLVMRVLLKCNGMIPHSRLLRWLSHQLDSQRVRSAIALLRQVGLVETFTVKGNDPMRPIAWHRLNPAGSS